MNAQSTSRLATLVIAILFLPVLGVAETFTVTTETDTDCSDGTCDFQSALTAAAGNGEDDVLNLPDTSEMPGGYIPTSTTFDYTAGGGSDLVINGSESGRTEFNGGKSARILSIQATGGSSSSPIEISVSNVTFRHGDSGGTNGGGLAISVHHGNVTVEGCSFIGNAAGAANGGGAWLGVNDFGSGSATVRNNTFSDNSAVNGAGLWIGFPSATIEDNRFNDNLLTDTGSGGGAYVSGNSGTIAVRGNTFHGNSSALGVEDCQGGGLYLSTGGFDETAVEQNFFERNLLGHSGSGAGAYVSRVDGPLIIEANTFRSNVIGGTAEDTGGGGLWVNLYGSFAECTIVNNAFVDNITRHQGTAAWIYSLDGGILFANNTATHNFPLIVFGSGSNAVLIDSPQVNLYNNIIVGNGTLGYDLLVRDGFVTETVTLRNNDIGRYSLPPEVNLDAGGNIAEDPGFIGFSNIHLGSPTSPAVDTGTTYSGMPTTDLDGEMRVIDGDGNGTAVVDIGADELGGVLVLHPDDWRFMSREENYAPGLGLLSLERRTYYLSNVGIDPIQITSAALETESTDWSLDRSFYSGQVLNPGLSLLMTVSFQAQSRKDSNNRLIVETTGGSVSAELFGDYEPLSHSDGDGVLDEEEGGDYDGNCDHVPDSEQSHVASLLIDLRFGRVTIVAPTEPVGALGEFYPTTTPLLIDVAQFPAPDEGGGPSAHGYPYGFLSFGVTTNRGIAGAGGWFPVSIILPADGPTVDGYVKRGPVPADFPPSLVDPAGHYDFFYGRFLDYAGFRIVGAVIENDVPLCDGEDHQVIHLRLRDGQLGDADLVADGVVRDPGGPAIMPEGFWDDDETVRIFPGAASASGVGDAFFVTDARLYNQHASEPITVNLAFLARDADNSGAGEQAVTIPPRRGVAFNDIVGEFFGRSEVAGAIRMRSDDLFYATSRTYNVGGSEGTFGSFIPGLPEEDAVDHGILLQVVNNPADDGFRANVGFVNPNLSTTEVTVRVYDADTGALIGENALDLEPRTFSQINNVFKFVGQKNRVAGNATVEFSASRPVFAYAAVIDNTSDDPIVVLPYQDEGTPRSKASLSYSRIIPGAANASGVGDAFFVTDARLYNPDPSASITVNLSFLARDADNSGVGEQTVTIPPRRGVAFNDIVGEFFGRSEVAGAIRMRSAAPFYATSRTYNVGGSEGTFGSFIPGLLEEDAIDHGILLQIVNNPADDGFRANVGFVNPNLNTTAVTVRVYDADTGVLIGERGLDLKPRTFSQINNVFKFVGQKNRVVGNASVEFSSSRPVFAYAAVIDNTSDDPIVVLPFEDQGTR